MTRTGSKSRHCALVLARNHVIVRWYWLRMTSLCVGTGSEWRHCALVLAQKDVDINWVFLHVLWWTTLVLVNLLNFKVLGLVGHFYIWAITKPCQTLFYLSPTTRVIPWDSGRIEQQPSYVRQVTLDIATSELSAATTTQTRAYKRCDSLFFCPPFSPHRCPRDVQYWAVSGVRLQPCFDLRFVKILWNKSFYCWLISHSGFTGIRRQKCFPVRQAFHHRHSCTSQYMPSAAFRPQHIIWRYYTLTHVFSYIQYIFQTVSWLMDTIMWVVYERVSSFSVTSSVFQT